MPDAKEILPTQEKDISPKNLPCNKFAEVCGFFGGPTVTVYVGKEDAKKKYILPKTYLCNQSAYFRAAFNVGFKEGQEQVLDLDDDDPFAFELIIQWLFTVLPPTKDLAPSPKLPEDSRMLQPKAKKLTKYLAFFLLSDKLQLQSSRDKDIIDKMRDCLSPSTVSLRPFHIRTAIKLPSRHPVRKLFADATVKQFVCARKTGKIFRFQTETLELDGYAADLLLSFDSIIRNCRVWTKNRKHRGYVVSIDPFTGQEFKINSLS